MKKIGIIALAALLYSGAATAQDGPDNIVQALLGPTGPVQGLFQSLQQRNLQPLVDGLVSDTGVIQGDVATPLNRTLSGLLVGGNTSNIVNGLGTTLITTTRAVGAGVFRGQGLQRLVLGSDALMKLPLTAEAGEGLGATLIGALGNGSFAFGGGLFGGGMVSGSGQGLSADEIPLRNIDPASQSALANNVKLQGL